MGLFQQLTTHLWREVHFHGCVCRPVAHGEYVHCEVNGAWCTLVLHMLKTKIAKTNKQTNPECTVEEMLHARI